MVFNKIEDLYVLVKETGYIQSLTICRDMEEDSTKDFDMHLVLSKCPSTEEEKKVELVFHDVQELKIGNINNFYKLFLEVTDVSDRQLESIKYYVDEVEYNMLSLSCFEITYNIL